MKNVQEKNLFSNEDDLPEEFRDDGSWGLKSIKKPNLAMIIAKYPRMVLGATNEDWLVSIFYLSLFKTLDQQNYDCYCLKQVTFFYEALRNKEFQSSPWPER